MIAIAINNSVLAIGWVVTTWIIALGLLFMYRHQDMQLFLLVVNYFAKVEEAANRQRKDVERLSQEIRSLISYISHDLKTVSYS
jgi:hypothetical protein